MSLKQFVELPHVRARLNPVVEHVPRPVKYPLLVPPVEGDPSRAGRLGTAFDYLLRFEIGRRATFALETPWVAYTAVQTLPLELLTEDGSSSPWQSAANALRGIEVLIRSYRKMKSPTNADIRSAARGALVLARIDPFYRAGFHPAWLRDALAEPLKDEVDELLRMFDATPHEKIVGRHSILLNPSFGRHSRVVAGADADLVIDDLLLDIKTGRKCSVSLEYLRQLTGYLLLARAMREDDRRFPEVRRLGFLFPRFGLFWSFDADAILSHCEFGALEHWWKTTLRADRLPPQPFAGIPVKAWLKQEPTEIERPFRTIVSMLDSEATEKILLERAIAAAKHEATHRAWPTATRAWNRIRKNLARRIELLLSSKSRNPIMRVKIQGFSGTTEINRPVRGVLVVRIPTHKLERTHLVRLASVLATIGGRAIRIKVADRYPYWHSGWRLVVAIGAEPTADLLLGLAEIVGARPPKSAPPARSRRRLSRQRAKTRR